MAHPKWASKNTQPSPKIYRPSPHPPIVNDRALTRFLQQMILVLIPSSPSSFYFSSSSSSSSSGSGRGCGGSSSIGGREGEGVYVIKEAKSLEHHYHMHTNVEEILSYQTD